MPDPDGNPTLAELAAAAMFGGAETGFQPVQRPDGSLWKFDRATGASEQVAPPGTVQPADNWIAEQDPNTKIFYFRNTTTNQRFKVSNPPGQVPLPAEGISPSISDLPDGSKVALYDLRPYGGKLETFVIPAGTEPFTLGQVQERDGHKFIEVAPGQFEALPQEFQPGISQLGDREFIQQRSGALQELDPRFQPEVTALGGREFLQQRSGGISELAPRPSNEVMDQIISEAIIAGEMDKALAYQDFRDRPSEQDALGFAMQFARSPADQQVISALARGETVVEQRPSTPTRVGPQPDFLINAYNKFQQAMTGGRAPTGEESQFFLGGPQRREQAKFAAQQATDEAKAQRDTEAMTQAGLKTAAMYQGFLDKFGEGFAAMVGGGQANIFKPLPTGLPTQKQATGTASGELAAQGLSIPSLTAASQASLGRQTQSGVPESNLTPAQIEFINTFSAGGRGLKPLRPMAQGGIVFGPTQALLGENGPEAVVPLTGPNALPFGLRQLQAGRQITPPSGNLFRSAGLQIPSAQALANLTPEDLIGFRDLGAQTGIPPGAFEQELRLGLPGGARVRSPMFLRFLAR